ncbi:hypothetical protein AB0E01_39640 [Nocardia vinacea]|uniref:hypothetical protein n=1 Tax=Nocardia vinacea TaxID=96468 RepID=UPI0033D90B04
MQQVDSRVQGVVGIQPRRRAHFAMIMLAATFPALAGCSGDKEVHFGESASLKLPSGATVEIAVTGYTHANSADFSKYLQNTSSISGKTPYYVNYTMKRTNDQPLLDSEQVGGTDIGASDGSRPLERLQLMGVGYFPCEGVGTYSLKDKSVGASVSGCRVFLAGSGVGAPTSVEFYDDKTDPEKVTWTK